MACVKNGLTHEEVHGITKTEIDQWFDTSIQKYNELIMLEIEQIPRQLALGGQDTLFILENKRYSEGRTQILSLYQLPDKIVESRQDAVVKSANMGIKAGIFLDSKLHQIVPLYGKNRVVASEKSIPGLSIFASSEQRGIIEKENRASALASSTGLIAANIALVDEETLILAKTVGSASYSYNLASDASHQLKLEDHSSISTELIPFVISRHTVALGVQNTGLMTIYDLRSHSPTTTIDYIGKIPGSKPAKVHFNASYRPTSPYRDSIYVVAATNEGKTVVHDLRSPSQPFVEGTTFPCSSVRMSPTERYFSAAANTADVGVFSFSTQIMQVFSHEGHNKVELSCSCTNEPVDHLWFDDATIISSALNRSVNIWQFIV